MSSTIWSTWVMVPNPAHRGTPRILEPVCHDKTPFLTIRCNCRADNHFHESQFETIPADDTDMVIHTRCTRCRRVMTIPVSFVRMAFQQMRDDGWIAPKEES